MASPPNPVFFAAIARRRIKLHLAQLSFGEGVFFFFADIPLTSTPGHRNHRLRPRLPQRGGRHGGLCQVWLHPLHRRRVFRWRARKLCFCLPTLLHLTSMLPQSLPLPVAKFCTNALVSIVRTRWLPSPKPCFLRSRALAPCEHRSRRRQCSECDQDAEAGSDWVECAQRLWLVCLWDGVTEPALEAEARGKA